MEFKDRVFQARKAKGLSQEELAALVGVSRQAVSKWETGEAIPDMEKLIALCNALDQNMEYLVLCEDKILNQMQTCSCTFDGNFYRVSLERPERYRYYLTAVLTYKGIKKQMPLLEIDGDESVFSAVHLWEGSQ